MAPRGKRRRSKRKRIPSGRGTAIHLQALRSQGLTLCGAAITPKMRRRVVMSFDDVLALDGTICEGCRRVATEAAAEKMVDDCMRRRG